MLFITFYKCYFASSKNTLDNENIFTIVIFLSKELRILHCSIFLSSCHSIIGKNALLYQTDCVNDGSFVFARFVSFGCRPHLPLHTYSIYKEAVFGFKKAGLKLYVTTWVPRFTQSVNQGWVNRILKKSLHQKVSQRILRNILGM